MKYIDAEKLIAEIERQQRRLIILSNTEQVDIRRDCALQNGVYDRILNIINSFQQEQPVHSHYTKVRETKTGRVFLAEYSSEAAEWYEAGTGKAYSISDVEIVKEQPEVDLEKDDIIYYVHSHFYYDKDFDGYGHSELRPVFTRDDVEVIARHFYELGLNARKDV